ncbi:MAG: hypothetical protein ABSF83_03400 [Nitrososphaerales archaeon]|jgi:hypothetical protein
MEPKQEEQERKLTREEFERLTSEMRALVGGKLRDHKDGDAELRLFKKELPSSRARRRTRSRAHP